MKFSFDSRAKAVSVAFVVVSIVIGARLYFLQIVHGEEYRTKSENNKTVSTPIFDRGSIYFANKDGTPYTAAILESGYILGIEPTKISDAEEIFQKLSAILTLDKDKFLEKARLTDDPYEEIAKRIPADQAKKIEDLKLTGVNLQKEQWRVYPGNRLSAHTLGFVGYNGDIIEGRYGLERYYEDNLKRDQSATNRNFFLEVFGSAGKAIGGGKELEANIVASVEPTVQQELENELKAVINRWEPKTAGGIIMNPTTGEIFAMASLPNFDPNNYRLEDDISVFSNPLVEKVFEMGSIIKPITMASALDSDIVTADQTYEDKGMLVIGDRTIYNFDKKGRGRATMQDVLNFSLNTGAAHVALLMGKSKFTEYIENFGLGEETGIDLPSEISGLTKNLIKGGDVEVATASYGQGIALTPIETIRALSALGNGGLLPNPHIVKRIDYRLGMSKNIAYSEEELRRVIKPETSEEITRMLVEVVDKALKNGAVKMDHYSIAAKTGTAQIADRVNGGYYSDRFLHSFFGYFPAYNPKFIVFLFTEEPKAEYASNTLTDPFINIAKFLINYYEIPPDR